MKKIYLTLFIAFLGGQLMAQSSTTTNENSTKKKGVVNKSTSLATTTATTTDLPSVTTLPGFPVYENTGNKELDDANYSVAKQNWIKENQATYDNYFGTSNTAVQGGTVTNISKAQWENMPENRRTYILEHPELYSVEK